MKEYICKEVPTENGGYLEIETEMIRCKDCVSYENGICYMLSDYTTEFRDENDYCSDAERRGEE